MPSHHKGSAYSKSSLDDSNTMAHNQEYENMNEIFTSRTSLYSILKYGIIFMLVFFSLVFFFLYFNQEQVLIFTEKGKAP